MATRQETASRDEHGVRKQNYRRFKDGRDYEKVNGPDMLAICEMMYIGVFGDPDDPEDQERKKVGQPRKYENVEDFKKGVEKYFHYIGEKNAQGVRLIPDVEGLALYLGIARSMLYEWQKTRGNEYADAIKVTLNAIAAAKKQLALQGKIPPVVFATDFNNNHGYIQNQTIEVGVKKPFEELPNKESIQKMLPNTTQSQLPGGSDVVIDVESE